MAVNFLSCRKLFKKDLWLKYINIFGNKLLDKKVYDLNCKHRGYIGR